MKYFVLLLSAILLASGCMEKPDNLATLASYMTGSFSSQEQAQSDSNFFDIRLEMVRIWQERSDGYWFYVEQANANNLEKPYRQRVYHLTQQSDSLLQSGVYTFENPLNYAGAWKDANPLSDLSPDKLTEREGCAVVLKEFAPGVFVGNTESLRCNSDLRGASYATSIVIIDQNQMYSWDRGFDISGEQVWGAKTGGYVFKRVNK